MAPGQTPANFSTYQSPYAPPQNGAQPHGAVAPPQMPPQPPNVFPQPMPPSTWGPPCQICLVVHVWTTRCPINPNDPTIGGCPRCGLTHFGAPNIICPRNSTHAQIRLALDDYARASPTPERDAHMTSLHDMLQVHLRRMWNENVMARGQKAAQKTKSQAVKQQKAAENAQANGHHHPPTAPQGRQQ